MTGRAMRGWLRRPPGGSRASAAVEFAILAPLMLLVGLASIEYSAAVRAQHDIGRAARYVAEILQNQTSVSAAQLQDYFVAGEDMYAGGGADGTLALSAASIKFTNLDTNGDATTFSYCTGWDAANAATTPAYTAMPAAALGHVSDLTDGYDNDSTIIVAASASYTPPFIPHFFGAASRSFTFTSIARVRPRNILQIVTSPSPGFSSC